MCPTCMGDVMITYEINGQVGRYRLQKWSCPICQATNTLTLAGRILGVAGRDDVGSRPLRTDATDEQAERETLQREKARLVARLEILVAETGRLRDSTHQDALLAHAHRLYRHQVELDAFHAALDSFHRRFGPLE